MRKRKILSILLTAAMVLTLVPGVTAAAAGDKVEIQAIAAVSCWPASRDATEDEKDMFYETVVTFGTIYEFVDVAKHTAKDGIYYRFNIMSSHSGWPPNFTPDTVYIFKPLSGDAIWLENPPILHPLVAVRYPDNPLPLPSDPPQALSSPILTNSTKAYFGGYEWVIIGWDGEGIASATDAATLLYANNNSHKPTSIRFNDSSSNHYADSNLQSVMNNPAIFPGITDRERNVITPRNLTGRSGNITFITGAYGMDTTSFSSAAIDYQDRAANESQYTGDGPYVQPANTFDWYAYDSLRRSGAIGGEAYTGTYHPDRVAGSSVDNQYFWPLSVAEASLLDGSIRSYSTGWWLRSPGDYDNTAARVNSSGDVIAFGHSVGSSYAVRPAFNLDLTSVIFTSAAAGGKSTAVVDGGLVGATAPTGAVKFTVIDDYNASTNPTGLALTCADTARFTVPDEADLPDGSYTIKLFAEEANGDNLTDFCSTPISIPLTVDNTPPTVVSVTPTGTGAAISGDVVITFSEPIDTAAAGTVQLNSLAPLTGGAWSGGGTVYTVPYSGLSYNTAYTVNISGFNDTVGNTMTADSANSFTTVAETYTLTVIAGTGGTVSGAASGDYEQGERFSVTATAYSGYRFAGWEITGTVFSGGAAATTANPVTFDMPADAVTLTANFAYTGGTSGGGGSYLPPNPGFSFSGGSSVYVKGSGQPLIFLVQKDFSYFDSVGINGKTITRNTHYKAESGSTKITLFADYLDTLEPGKHTAEVRFTDGTYARADFTIVDAPQPENPDPGAGTSPEKETESGSVTGVTPGIPKTGAIESAALIALIGAAATLFKRRDIRGGKR